MNMDGGVYLCGICVLAEQEVLSMLPSPDVSEDEGEGDPLRAIEAEVTRYQSPVSPTRKRLRIGDDPGTVPRTFSSYHHPRFPSGSYDPHTTGHMSYTYEASLMRNRRSKDSSSDSGCTEEEDSRYCSQSNPQFLSRGGSMGAAHEMIYPEQGDYGFVTDHPLASMHQGGVAGASCSWNPNLQSHPVSHFYGPPYLPQSTAGSYHPSPFPQDYMHHRYHQQFNVAQHTPSSVAFPPEGVDVPTMEKTYRPCPPQHDEVHTAPHEGVYGEEEDRAVEGKSQETTDVLDGSNRIVEGGAGQGEGMKEEGLPLPRGGGGEQGEDASTMILLENNSGCNRDAAIERPGVSSTEWPSIEQEPPEGGEGAYQFPESHEQPGDGEVCTASEGVGVVEFQKADMQSSSPLIEEHSALESAGGGGSDVTIHAPASGIFPTASTAAYAPPPPSFTPSVL